MVDTIIKNLNVKIFFESYQSAGMANHSFCEGLFPTKNAMLWNVSEGAFINYFQMGEITSWYYISNLTRGLANCLELLEICLGKPT